MDISSLWTCFCSKECFMTESGWRRCKWCYGRMHRKDYTSDRGFNTAVQAHEHRCEQNPNRIEIHDNFRKAKCNGGRKPRVVQVKATEVQTINGSHHRSLHFRTLRKAAAGGYAPKFCTNCGFDLQAHGSSGRQRFNFCPDCGGKLPG